MFGGQGQCLLEAGERGVELGLGGLGACEGGELGDLGLDALLLQSHEALLVEVHLTPKPGLVDLRKDRPRRGSFLAPTLRTALQETLADGGQAMLFLNRRGYASSLQCYECGEIVDARDGFV